MYNLKPYYPKPSDPRPIYGDFEPMRGIYLPDPRIPELIKQGYKGIYDARTGILTMYKEEEKGENNGKD